MNPYFNLGDWIVIIAYLGGIIGLGVWFGKDQRNTRDYFLGSRNIPWWRIGVSIVAAETSALTIIGVPAIAYGGKSGRGQSADCNVGCELRLLRPFDGSRRY